jgi:peptidoglycan/xylan/chitin deacetylase (PgdA/CDA1 family)
VETVLSLDVEDFVTPEAADAERWWARELADRGIRASFQVVGELLRARREAAREDVIEALSGHEIGYHTDRHSLPPRHAELASASLADAVARVSALERPGLEVVRRVFGREPVAFSAPGGAWTAPALLAMAAAGLRVLANGGGLTGRARRPLWFCGLLVTDRAMRLDDYMGSADELEALFWRHLEVRRREAAEDGVLVIGAHPDRLVTARFWDAPLYAGADVRRSGIGRATLWPAARVERLKDRARRWLDGLREHPGLRLTDFAGVHARRSARAAHDLASLLHESRLEPGDVGRLPLRPPRGRKRLRSNEGRFEWAVLPPGLDVRPLLALERGLAWTARPSRVRGQA